MLQQVLSHVSVCTGHHHLSAPVVLCSASSFDRGRGGVGGRGGEGVASIIPPTLGCVRRRGASVAPSVCNLMLFTSVFP